jgi:hypothetical protein
VLKPVAHVCRARLHGEWRQRIAAQTVRAERFEHRQRAIDELGRGADHGDPHIVASDPPQPQQSLDAGDSSAGNDHIEYRHRPPTPCASVTGETHPAPVAALGRPRPPAARAPAETAGSARTELLRRWPRGRAGRDGPAILPRDDAGRGPPGPRPRHSIYCGVSAPLACAQHRATHDQQAGLAPPGASAMRPDYFHLMLARISWRARRR